MLAQGSNQASKGEQQTERNEEPGVPPGEGGSSHPLEGGWRRGRAGARNETGPAGGQ